MSFLSRIMVLKSKAHFNTDARSLPAFAKAANFQGTRKTSGAQAKSRISILIGCFASLIDYMLGLMRITMPRLRAAPPSVQAASNRIVSCERPAPLG